MEKSQIEKVLRKIKDLEAGHVEIKQEISKIVSSGTLVSEDSAAGETLEIDGGDDGGDAGACVEFDYYASWRNVAGLMGSSSRFHDSSHRDWRPPPRDFRGGGAGARFLPPTFHFTAKQCLNILQSMGQAFHIVDVNNRLIYWNKSAERLYGYTAVEAVSNEVFELMVDEEYHELGNNIVSRVKILGEAWTGLFPVRSKRGRRFSVIITDSPLYDEDGTLIGVSCVACDSRPFQNNRFALPGARNSEADVSFGYARSAVTTKHAFLPEQPRQVTFSSKIIDMATRVSNRVRSKMKTGKGVVEHEVGNSNDFHSDHGSSIANAFLNKDSISLCRDGLKGNAAPSFGSGSNPRKDWGENSEGKYPIRSVSLNVEDWIRKSRPNCPWEGNNHEFLEARSNKLGWPCLLGDNDHDHSSLSRRLEFQANERVSPNIAESYESTSLFSFSSTSSSSSSESECSSSVQKLEITTDLDYEVHHEDLNYEEQIGQGSCGTVYRGLWCGSDVAIKVFSGAEYSEETVLSFRQEVSLMKVLRHPNVLLFMGAVTSPKRLCIITEFLPRGSLFHLLHRQSDKLDWRRRASMALDIALGMNYLHHFTPPIIHCDLTSSNLLVDMNWNVKVADFGLSRIKHETFLITKAGTGTPQWMAPELCRYEPSDEKSDIYSFGVILWELATEKIPWEDLDSMQVIGAVGFMNQRLEIPSDVDPKWSAMIESCWQSEPQSRPSFQELIIVLKDLVREYAIKYRRRDRVGNMLHRENKLLGIS